MIARIISTLTMLMVTCCVKAQEASLLWEAGEYVEVTKTSTAKIEPKKDHDDPGVAMVLDKISIVLSKDGPPPCYVVSGRVVSGNSGFPLERIPVLVGVDHVEPTLAALTNMDGEFKFRLWIKEDQRDFEIQVLKDFAGFLYVGSFSAISISKRYGLPGPSGERSVWDYYRRYSLKRLLEISNASKK